LNAPSKVFRIISFRICIAFFLYNTAFLSFLTVNAEFIFGKKSMHVIIPHQKIPQFLCSLWAACRARIRSPYVKLASNNFLRAFVKGTFKGIKTYLRSTSLTANKLSNDETLGEEIDSIGLFLGLAHPGIKMDFLVK